MPRVLAGRYEIGELIGRGGMAEVRIGKDSRLGRTVAIKLLRTDLGEDPTFHARFRREAQSAAALNHPAIVSVYDTGEEPFTDARGNAATLPYIVMEYVEGHTVRELLTDGAAVPIDEAIEITVGILGALEYAHNEGIVHRDIKPGNIMLTPKGQVKVMDFGIARAMSDQQATMTQANSVVGTAQYLSPEQARGEAVDQRSDIYSTGVLLYELLTGRPPFQGDSALSVAYQHVREIPPIPSSLASDLPDSLDRVVMKALAKDLDERYQDANQFRADLLAVLRGGAVNAPAATQYLPVGAAAAAGPATAMMGAPMSRTPEAATPAATGTIPTTRPIDDDGDKKNRWWIWLIALLALAGVVLGAMALLNGGEDTPELVAVPDVTNMDQAAAAAELQALGFVVADGGTEYSAEVAQGLATRSDPAAGTELAKGETVTVFYSAGVEVRTVPDLIGLTVEQAQDTLEGRDLELGLPTSENMAGVPKGEVFESDPAADEEVPVGSEVNVLIGTGYVELSDLSGKPQADAEALLRDSFKLDFVVEEEFNADVEPGQVIRTSPGAGEVKVDETITLYVSKGAENQSPTISGADEPLEITQGQDFDLMDGVTASDEEDGDLTASVRVEDNIDNTVPGTYQATYSVTDADGATTEVSRVVVVMRAAEPEPTTEAPTTDEQTDGGGEAPSGGDAPGNSGNAPGNSGGSRGNP